MNAQEKVKLLSLDLTKKFPRSPRETLAGYVNESLEIYIHTPTDFIPRLANVTEFIRSWRGVAVCSRNPKALNCTISKRINRIARCDFAHGFVEGIDLVVLFPFGRPDVFAEEFLAKGLLVIDPPEVHFIRFYLEPRLDQTKTGRQEIAARLIEL